MKAALGRTAVSRVLLVALITLSACTPISYDRLDPDATLPTIPVAIGSDSGRDTSQPTPDDPSSTTATTLPPLEPATFESLSGINVIPNFSGYGSRGLTRWQSLVPGVEDIRIISTVDGDEQPALWVAPRGDRPRPLLVVLHSWSSSYVQHAGIPFAMWAQENGWAVIAPNFRGVNNNPEAIGSDVAVQDVIDAIDYGISQEGVDQDRVYTIGYSGGGMMSLLLAGRHPDRVTAVAAWGPVYDLVEFYRSSRSSGRSYAWDIFSSCEGDPSIAGPAQEECRRRSPLSYLDAARENGVPVYIGQGINDWLLRPSQAANAFNHLAHPEDRLTVEEVAEIDRRILPAHLVGSITTETHFSDSDPRVVFARQSDSVWFVLFQAAHEMAYAPALRWFASDPR